MRRKKTNSDLELYAVSGTHTVVLSMDMKKKPDGLLGFAFAALAAGNRAASAASR